MAAAGIDGSGVNLPRLSTPTCVESGAVDHVMIIVSPDGSAHRTPPVTTRANASNLT